VYISFFHLLTRSPSLFLSPLFLPTFLFVPFLPFSLRFPTVKRSAAEFLDDAGVNVLAEDVSYINGDPVPNDIVGYY
jgi:hypothetical protein